MALIGTLAGIAILVLIGKAVIETFWGLYFIALGLFWHTVAISISALAVDGAITATTSARKKFRLNSQRLPPLS